MSVVAQTLFEETAVPNVDTTMYTAPTNSRVYIDKLTVTNPTAGALTITVNLVPSGGSVASTNVITSAYSIAAGGSYTFPEIVGHILGAGAFISAVGSAAGLNMRASGRVMT